MSEKTSKKTAVNQVTNRQNLLDVVPALQGLEAFVFYGTLLGLERDGDIIPNDDDIDFLVNKLHCDQLVANIEKLRLGYEIRRNPDFPEDILQIARTLNGEVVLADFYLFSAPRRTDFIVDRWNFLGRPDIDEFSLHIPRSLVFPICHREVFGTPIPFPTNARALCKFLYGESWQTPAAKGTEYVMTIADNKPLLKRTGTFTLKKQGVSQQGRTLLSRIQQIDEQIQAHRAANVRLEQDRDQLIQELIALGDMVAQDPEI